MSMHIDHKAGEELFVDYAGDKLAIVDPDSGAGQPVETFVAILGASATQQREDWTRSNERALHYYGGGVQVIIPANLRSAVSRSDPYEPGINTQFDAFAQYYGIVIMPARVRHARDKALVESAVRLTYQRIYPPLRKPSTPPRRRADAVRRARRPPDGQLSIKPSARCAAGWWGTIPRRRRVSQPGS